MKLNILLVEDHEAVIIGTKSMLQGQYQNANIIAVQTAKQAEKQIHQHYPDLLVIDLSIPQTSGEKAHPDIGIRLLRSLMAQHRTLNILVQTMLPHSLIHLKPTIHAHEGGFTVIDKSSPIETMLTRADWALQGINHTPIAIRNGLEFRPEWLTVLQLAFQEGYEDKKIAATMNRHLRTIRNYWSKIQDALEVYPEEGKSLRIQTELRARETGLIP